MNNDQGDIVQSGGCFYEGLNTIEHAVPEKFGRLSEIAFQRGQQSVIAVEDPIFILGFRDSIGMQDQGIALLQVDGFGLSLTFVEDSQQRAGPFQEGTHHLVVLLMQETRRVMPCIDVFEGAFSRVQNAIDCGEEDAKFGIGEDAAVDFIDDIFGAALTFAGVSPNESPAHRHIEGCTGAFITSPVALNP